MIGKLQALIRPLLTVLSLFGINLSPEVRQVLADNIGLLVTALGALGSVLPSIIAAFKPKT